jgi:hypothetical protein
MWWNQRSSLVWISRDGRREPSCGSRLWACFGLWIILMYYLLDLRKRCKILSRLRQFSSDASLACSVTSCVMFTWTSKVLVNCRRRLNIISLPQTLGASCMRWSSTMTLKWLITVVSWNRLMSFNLLWGNSNSSGTSCLISLWRVALLPSCLWHGGNLP